MNKLYINVFADSRDNTLLLDVDHANEVHPNRFKNYYKRKRGSGYPKGVRSSTFKVTDIDDINNTVIQYLNEGYELLEVSFEGTFDIRKYYKILVYKIPNCDPHIHLYSTDRVNAVLKEAEKYNPKIFDYNDYEDAKDYCNKLIGSVSYSWFSNLKGQLIEAPIEVKKAFNEVVNYFAEIG